MAILSYIYILFLVPIIMGLHKTSAFVKFHVNQGIILAIGWVGWTIIGIILTSVIKVSRASSIWGVGYSYRVTPSWLTIIVWLVQLGFCALAVLGILNAVGGKFKGLPVVGDKITIIK